MKVVQPPVAPIPDRKPEPPAAAPAADASGASFRAVLADGRPVAGHGAPLPGRKPSPPVQRAEAAPTAPLPGTKPAPTLFLANEGAGEPPPLPADKPEPPPLRLASVPGAPLPGRKPDAAVPVAVAALPERKPAAPEAAPAEQTAAARLSLASRQVAGLSGHSYAAILAQASQESGMNPAARSRTSSASGPFQFLERTWLDLVRRHGAAYGLGDLAQRIESRGGLPVVKDAAVRKRILDLRHDIDLSAGMAARYLAEGRERLEARLKRPVSETESRIAYVMGVGGAAKLIRAAERTPHAAAADLLPAAARANRPLFYDRASGRALTAVETVSRLTHRMETEQRAMFAAIDEAAQRIVLDGRPSPLGSFRMVRAPGEDGGDATA
ncbi:lytic transglycosylase domain-containing protein [Azospirillum sp. A39]|uniref:lytic transglycosylase domain-containing protein n=1 Tax=Azospirillum sp. A39 TaxID=3462279 RepID=UPI00404622B9